MHSLPQLAIVTGAPEASLPFFDVLALCQPRDSLASVLPKVRESDGFRKCSDAQVVERILVATGDWPGTELFVDHLVEGASIARRYSFTARPH